MEVSPSSLLPQIDKSKDEVSRTMVSQVSIAMMPIRNEDMKVVFDDHL